METLKSESKYVYEQQTLRGHRKPIDSIKVKSFPDTVPSLLANKTLIFTGSEDGMIRVWDADSLRSIKSFKSAYFMSNIDNIGFHPQNQAIIFCTIANNVISLNLSTPNIIETEVQSCFSSDEINGEINALAVHPSKPILAVSDDSYAVFLINFDSEGVFSSGHPSSEQASAIDSSKSPSLHTLRRLHTNIINCLLFTTHMKRDEIYAGAFDCEISYWEIERPNRPNKTVKMNVNDENKTETQTLNPPFIYALSLICNNKVLVTGVGDGSIKLYHSAQLTLLTQKLVHSGPVATVKVIGNYIISGGIVMNLTCPKLLT
eukprot:gene9829-10673_t